MTIAVIEAALGRTAVMRMEPMQPGGVPRFMEWSRRHHGLA